MEVLDFILNLIKRVASYLWFSHNGHIAHFIVGLLIGGFVSIFLYKNSFNKMKSVLLGFVAASLVGMLKELIDPFIQRQMDMIDFLYTSFGGFLGCLIILSERLLRFIYPENK